jgi:uncharacterized protein (TIGR03437 family)
MQFNVQIPPGSSTGNLPMVLTINGTKSQSNIYVAVSQ